MAMRGRDRSSDRASRLPRCILLSRRSLAESMMRIEWSPGRPPGYLRDCGGTDEGWKSPVEQSVSFGRYRFDLETGRLWSGKREVKLTPKACAVLKALVTHAGQPVRKEELFASVWNGTVVSDDALTSCIQELRKALADDAKKPRFIETRHRRGYRFIARVSKLAAKITAESEGAPEHTSKVARAAAGDLDLDALWTQPAIAVFPFEDLSEIVDRAHFADGITQDITTALSCWRRFPVIARNSTSLSKEKHGDPWRQRGSLGHAISCKAACAGRAARSESAFNLSTRARGRRFGRAGMIVISVTCLPCRMRLRLASSKALSRSSAGENSIARCVSIRRISTAGTTRSAPFHASMERCRTSTHSLGRMPPRPATCSTRRSSLTLRRPMRIRCWRCRTSMTPWRTGQRSAARPHSDTASSAPCGRARRR